MTKTLKARYSPKNNKAMLSINIVGHRIGTLSLTTVIIPNAIIGRKPVASPDSIQLKNNRPNPITLQIASRIFGMEYTSCYKKNLTKWSLFAKM
jgi:hypothetical protein